MISQLTFNHRKSSFALEMKIFYVFINSVYGDYCCFNSWTEWQQSSLTCGRVCQHRKRDLLMGAGGYLAAEECNYDYSPCPWTAWQEASCVSNDCRKFDFKILPLIHFLLQIRLKFKL